MLSTTIAVTTKFLAILDLHLRYESGISDAALVAAYFFADSVSRSVAVAMFYGSQRGVVSAGFMFGIFLLDFVWQAVTLEWERVSVAASLLSLFTALPLSSHDRDRLRLCFTSSLATVVMALWALFVGYHEIDDIGSGADAIYASSNATENGDTDDDEILILFSDNRVWPAMIVVVAFMVLKVGVYFSKVDGLQGGEGKIENTGLSLFALSDSSHQQFKTFNAELWEKYFRTESSAQLKKGIGRENSDEHRAIQKAIKSNAEMVVTMVKGLYNCQSEAKVQASGLLKKGKQSNLTHLCLRGCNPKEEWYKMGVFGTMMKDWLQTELILKELNLRECNITTIKMLGSKSMVDDIAEMLSKNKHLRTLDLGYNPGIGDDGFKTLMTAFETKSKNTTLADLQLKDCALTKKSGEILLKYLEWKLAVRAAEIDNELKNNKTDYWYVKALQAWGLMSVDLRKQISMPRAGMDIKDMRSALNVAAGKFEVELPTKKKDIVHVKMDLE